MVNLFTKTWREKLLQNWQTAQNHSNKIEGKRISSTNTRFCSCSTYRCNRRWGSEKGEGGHWVSQAWETIRRRWKWSWFMGTWYPSRCGVGNLSSWAPWHTDVHKDLVAMWSERVLRTKVLGADRQYNDFLQFERDKSRRVWLEADFKVVPLYLSWLETISHSCNVSSAAIAAYEKKEGIIPKNLLDKINSYLGIIQKEYHSLGFVTSTKTLFGLPFNR